MPVNLQAQILALRTAVEAAIAGSGSDTHAPDVPWTPGQRLTAQVESELPGGRYQIRVGNFQFDVELPVKAQVGDPLRLEFVAASPRVAFALLQTPGQETEAEGAASPRPPQVQISTAGRVLTAALQADQDPVRAPGSPPVPIEDPIPLLPAAPTDAAPLAAALQRAVDRSGLFYESHLVQWFAGERPLAALLREPQGRLSTLAQPSQPSPDDGSSEKQTRTPSNTPSDPTGPRTAADQPRSSAHPFHSQSLVQIRSQLDVIEQHQIVWQGQAWPGQPMEWRVDEPPEPDHPNAEALPWTTSLRLTLPRLGEVTAELGLRAGRVQVRVAAETGAAGALREGQSALTEALREAGLALEVFSVRTDDAA